MSLGSKHWEAACGRLTGFMLRWTRKKNKRWRILAFQPGLRQFDVMTSTPLRNVGHSSPQTGLLWVLRLLDHILLYSFFNENELKPP